MQITSELLGELCKFSGDHAMGTDQSAARGWEDLIECGLLARTSDGESIDSNILWARATPQGNMIVSAAVRAANLEMERAKCR